MLFIYQVRKVHQSSPSPEVKKELMKELLSKETKLLQAIDKLKISAKNKNRGGKLKAQLERMAQPKVWAQSDNETTTVHTPFTTRAKELLDLYNGLSLGGLSVDERLDVLLHVKWTVKEFDCMLTRDIVDLVDREADLLNRGRAEGSLSGARKRLAGLFLQFVNTADFNPEAMHYTKVARDASGGVGGKKNGQSAVSPLSTLPLTGSGGRR